MPKNGECLKNLRKKFPHLYEAKLKEAVLLEPDICQMMLDSNFEARKTINEKKEWISFKEFET